MGPNRFLFFLSALNFKFHPSSSASRHRTRRNLSRRRSLSPEDLNSSVKHNLYQVVEVEII
ncbi:hypothetical protein MTR67_037819, partial [Solanum verrucosum]